MSDHEEFNFFGFVCSGFILWILELNGARASIDFVVLRLGKFLSFFRLYRRRRRFANQEAPPQNY